MIALYGIDQHGSAVVIFGGVCTAIRDDGAVFSQPFTDVADQQPYVIRWQSGPRPYEVADAFDLAFQHASSRQDGES